MGREANKINLDDAELPAWADRFADRLAAALRAAMLNRPRAELDREIQEFLGVRTAPVAERLRYEALDISAALYALTRWCGLAGDVEERQGTVIVRGDVEGGRALAPIFSPVAVALDQTARCLSRGVVFLERSGCRTVIRIEYEPSHFCRHLTIDFLFDEAVRDRSARLIEDFRAAVERYDVARGQLLVFDRTGLAFLPALGVTWEDVVLPDHVRQEIHRHVLLYLDAWRNGDRSVLPPGRALLLSGPPGTGKTLVGKAIASALDGVTFLWVTPGGFESCNDAGHFFRWARKRAPAVLFFEEIDLITEGCDGPPFGELLAQMDGFVGNQGLVVIATTNEPEVLDQALMRPGRFDRHLVLALPAESERHRILERLLARERIHDRIATLQRVARATHGFSGAHLRELVDTVRFHLIETGDFGGVAELGVADFDRALAALRASRRDIGFTAAADRTRATG